MQGKKPNELLVALKLFMVSYLYIGEEVHEIDLNALVQKTQKLKLLYVEDLKNAREVVFEFLELFFDDISIAVDGEDAWNKYKLEKFDVILTDINMPNLNGLELSKKIRTEDDNIAILVLSAYNKTEYLLDSIKYGVDAYLLKPFEIHQFLDAMLKVVQKIQSHQKLETYSSMQIPKDIDIDEFHTNLPNAIALQEDLAKHKFNYMLLLDMSNFELLKQEYGKKFVSNVIIRTAHILKKLTNKNAKLYKIEAYKFVILLRDATVVNIHFYCEQIGMFFDNKNVVVDESELNIRFDIGVDKIRTDISQTLINCECALEIAKNLKNKHYEIYDEESSVCKNKEEATQNLRLTKELIANKGIKPYFQVIKNSINGKVQMYEAFARAAVGHKTVLPKSFIQASKKLGLSSEITKIMIDKSFKFFHNKSDNFSINLTELDLLDTYLTKLLKDKINEYAITPSRVTFEINEDIILDKKSKKIEKKLNKLRAMGFKIAVDNFSIEHSDLSKLFSVELMFLTNNYILRL